MAAMRLAPWPASETLNNKRLVHRSKQPQYSITSSASGIRQDIYSPAAAQT
jgi:hypothetical protein